MRVLVLAGDASGEKHAAAFVEALRERLPDVRVSGLGGVEMEKAGVELIVHQNEIAVGGLVEVVGSAGRLFSAWRRLVRALTEQRPALVVLVDAPDFNIPFARRARRAGVPVLYYVSPQVWAWRRGRVHKIARRVDRMAVIFPFEPEFYRDTSLPVEFVGHPLVERTQRAIDQIDRGGARAALGFDADARIVALLPGSRRNELRHGLPLFLDAVRVLHARDPRLVFALALAPTLPRELADEIVREAHLPAFVRLEIVEGRTYEAIRAADVALCMPGTATLEVALLGRPLVAALRVNRVSAWLARRLVSVPNVAMPNLIAGETLVPEFVQEEAQPEALAEALLGLLDGPARDRQLAGLARVREMLGRGGAAERAAAIAEEMIRGAG